MTFVLQIIAGWTLLNFAIGIPFWMRLARRNRLYDQETDRWLAGQRDFPPSRRGA